jgi:hypothetical protein
MNNRIKDFNDEYKYDIYVNTTTTTTTKLDTLGLESIIIII